LQCRRDIDRDRGKERDSERDRGHTQTQKPSKEYNIRIQKTSKQCIEMNKQIMKINDTRELCDLISTYDAEPEFNDVNVDTAFHEVLKKRGIPLKSLA